MVAPLLRNRTAETDNQKTAATLAISAHELDKILVLDPKNLRARMMSMSLALEQSHLGQNDRLTRAKEDLDYLLNHPDLADTLNRTPELFEFLHLTAERFARYGHTAEALRIAEQALALSNLLNRSIGRSHYYMAKILCFDARSNPAQVDPLAEHLQRAFVANTRFKQWYHQDHDFDPVRIRIDAALDRVVIPTPILRRQFKRNRHIHLSQPLATLNFVARLSISGRTLAPLPFRDSTARTAGV